MREVERAARQMFASVGMTAIAEAQPSSSDWFLAYQEKGLAWVVTDDDDVPIAYLLAVLVDGFVHVKEVAVHPDLRGHGVGKELLNHVAAWARLRALTKMTLTTFRDVPWNGPYYERLGFRELPDDEPTPALRGIFEDETRDVATLGFDRSTRVYMGRDLSEAD